MAHVRPTATHQVVRNNEDNVRCFKYNEGVFYALDSMDTFVIDQHGRVWKYACVRDDGATEIPLPWWRPKTYGFPVAGFVEPIAE